MDASPIQPNEARQPNEVRLDKWLWAARFYKTRALARQAVENGKIQYNGGRVRPSKSLDLGDKICVSRGAFYSEVIVTTLSTQRRSAEESARLYKETEESLAAREAGAAQRRYQRQGEDYYNSTDPNNQQRRQLSRFLGRRRGNHESEPTT